MSNRIGILGGTFNPVHTGHISLAEAAYLQFHLDKVIFLPSGQPYKKEASQVLPGKKRLELVLAAIEDKPYFIASDMEIVRPGKTYTYETLEELHRNNPSDELFFILGGDCLFSIEKWVLPQRIFAACTIIAAVRDDKDRAELENQSGRLKEIFGAKILLLDFEKMQISSTLIRDKIKNGESVQELLHPKTAEIIRKEGLYLQQR